MMDHEEILASPDLFSMDTHALNDLDYNKAQYREYMDIVGKSFIKVGSIDIYKATASIVVGLDHETESVAYYMKWKIDKMYGLEMAYQSMVWKDFEYDTDAVASRVFFEHLLPITGVVRTDYMQTVDGAKWWMKTMVTALQKGMCVYHAETPKTPTRITSPEDITGKWWKMPNRRQHLAFVSLKSLDFSS